MKPHLEIYRFLFARPAFAKLNRQMVLMGLKGLGVLNFENAEVSGERHFLQQWLSGQKRPVCLDVGANEGDYTQMLLQAQPQAQVHAFEPHLLTFARLAARHGGHVDIRLTNAGCGAEAGELELFDYAQGEGSSHASVHRGVIEKLRGEPSSAHRVPVVCVDDYLDANGIGTVDLLKIDTEGHELAVLQGARESLRAGRIRCVHLEFNEMNAYSHVHFLDLFEMLPNFRLHRLLPAGMLELENYSPLFCEIYAFQNIVAFLREPGRP